MSATREYVSLLMGGVGSRLWPHSRASLPKQFLKLSSSSKSILIESVDRFADWQDTISLLGTKDLDALTKSFLNLNAKELTTYFEPRGCNTAAAIALLCKIRSWEDGDVLLGVFPSDHYIPLNDCKAFSAVVKQAFKLADSQQKIITIGIKPSFPSTAYGYIKTADSCEGAYEVGAFMEKPDEVKAKKLLQDGDVYWNAGMFVFPVSVMIEEFKTHMPELWKKMDLLKKDLTNLEDVYADKLIEESIDYGVMEKSKKLLCLPASFAWSDLGSWESVAELQANEGDVTEQGAKNNSYIANENVKGKRAFFVGVDNVIVADTQDAVLVLNKGQGQEVKKLYNQLKESNDKIVLEHPFEYRPWGHFKILKDTEYFKSKIICVYPQQRLSYQSHKQRGEHWVMVKGTAEVVLNDKTHTVKQGESIHIPLGAKHRIINPGSEEIEFIEVQTGSYFGEDDIVRYEDDYGRS